MGVMKNEAHTRNIQVIDHSDGSGDIIAVTSVATLADDLIFLYDADPKECPKVYDYCIALARAYADGDDRTEYEDFLGIELRRV